MSIPFLMYVNVLTTYIMVFHSEKEMLNSIMKIVSPVYEDRSYKGTESYHNDYSSCGFILTDGANKVREMVGDRVFNSFLADLKTVMEHYPSPFYMAYMLNNQSEKEYILLVDDGNYKKLYARNLFPYQAPSEDFSFKLIVKWHGYVAYVMLQSEN